MPEHKWGCKVESFDSRLRKESLSNLALPWLELAENLELKSLLAALDEWGYDLELSGIDRESGRTMGAVLGRSAPG